MEHLRVAVLCLLVVQQSHHLSCGVEADVDLETGVTGTLSTVHPTAVRAVNIPHDGRVHNSAANLICPYAVEKVHSVSLDVECASTQMIACFI